MVKPKNDQAQLKREYDRKVTPLRGVCYRGHSLDDAIYQRTYSGVARKCRVCHNARARVADNRKRHGGS